MGDSEGILATGTSINQSRRIVYVRTLFCPWQHSNMAGQTLHHKRRDHEEGDILDSYPYTSKAIPSWNPLASLT